MKPKSISYSESKESVDAIGLKSWRKAGVEIELDGEDDVNECYNEAKRLVWVAMSPPTENEFPYDNPYIGYKPPILNASNGATPIPLPTIDYSAKEKVEKAIDDAKTIHELDLLLGEVAKYGLVKECLKKRNILNTYGVNAK